MQKEGKKVNEIEFILWSTHVLGLALITLFKHNFFMFQPRAVLLDVHENFRCIPKQSTIPIQY